MPYSFLMTVIKERNIKHKTIQNELGISKTMFSRKINGSRNGKFTLEEAIKIKENRERNICEMFHPLQKIYEYWLFAFFTRFSLRQSASGDAFRRFAISVI